MSHPLHFIQASDTSGLAALHTERGAIPAQYEALQAHLKGLGLERFGTLWAEPVTGQATPTGYASISWYTPLEGIGTPLSGLDAGEAEQARTELRRAREAIEPHLDDSPGGALLRKALFIPSTDNIFVVNGHPVLVNWGLLPQGTDESAAPILWGGPSGEPAPAPSPNSTAEPVSAVNAAKAVPHGTAAGAGIATGTGVDARTAGAVGSTGAAATAGTTGEGTAETVLVRRSRAGLFVALLLGLLLGVLLLFGLRACTEGAPETPAAPATPPAPVEAPEDAARRAERENLLREKAFWQALLELSPCELKAFFEENGKTPPAPDGARPVPGKPLPDAAPGGAVPGVSLPPLPSANATIPAKTADLSALTIPQRLEQGTVLILAPVPGGAQQGTGFFINPEQVLTNRHVVANAIGGQVVVTNAVLRGARRGTVVAQGSAPGSDFAVIRVAFAEGDRIPVLPLSTNVSRTDKVSAWGFPALVSEQDPAYLKLLGGDFSAVPEVVFTDGVVNAILHTTPPNIVHSAVVSQGNSGGPLVNEKGDVVGINTFIRLDADSNRQTQTALGSDAIMAFLREKGIPFTELK